jgi:hypothetical protein
LAKAYSPCRSFEVLTGNGLLAGKPRIERQSIVNLSFPDSSIKIETERKRGESSMRKYRTFAVLLVILSLLIPSVAYSLNHGLSAETGGEEGILVGRIAHVEGLVYRYIPEEGAWVQVAVDSPFGLEDKLRSDRRSRAEVILPNNTWFRMDGYTHLHLLSLHDEATEMHMVHGSARFMNKGSFPTIYVSTPFGEVSAPAQTSFDLHVSDSSMEAVALEGSVYFSRDGGRTKTEVTERSASLFADRYAVTAGERYRDSLWDAWNLERDALWAQRMRAGRVSAKYLPPALHDHGYALDDYGVWMDTSGDPSMFPPFGRPILQAGGASGTAITFGFPMNPLAT